MKPYQRVRAVIEGKTPDRIPRFEVWIDALHDELGIADPAGAHPELGQDVLLMPSIKPPVSNAWGDGLDEFGRIWKNGSYVNGALKTFDDLKTYTPPLSYAAQFFSEKQAAEIKDRYPEHFLFFGTHIGPFMNTYMALGMQSMFRLLRNDISLVRAVIESRTEWCVAVFKRAVELGAELIVMGDDAAYSGGPMISPQMWRNLVLPYHQHIVQELPVPVIWHSDGRMDRLLPFAVEAGFAGMHGLEPPAGNDLGRVKEQYGEQLILIGNVDVNLLCKNDPEAVREDIRRCLRQGGKSGYMLSSSNSIFPGMNPGAVCEYFRYSIC